MVFSSASSGRSTLSGVPLIVRIGVLTILSVPLIGTVFAYREASARAWRAYVATETAPSPDFYVRRVARLAKRPAP